MRLLRQLMRRLLTLSVLLIALGLGAFSSPPATASSGGIHVSADRTAGLSAQQLVEEVLQHPGNSATRCLCVRPTRRRSSGPSGTQRESIKPLGSGCG
jgi:hypothetical protein